MINYVETMADQTNGFQASVIEKASEAAECCCLLLGAHTIIDCQNGDKSATEAASNARLSPAT